MENFFNFFTVTNDGIDALDDFLQSLQNLSLNSNGDVAPSNQNKKNNSTINKKHHSTSNSGFARKSS